MNVRTIAVMTAILVGAALGWAWPMGEIAAADLEALSLAPAEAHQDGPPVNAPPVSLRPTRPAPLTPAKPVEGPVVTLAEELPDQATVPADELSTELTDESLNEAAAGPLLPGPASAPVLVEDTDLPPSPLPAHQSPLQVTCKAPPAARPGERITLQVNLKNAGPAPLENVVLTPHRTTAGTSRDAERISFQLGSLLPGRTVMVPLTAEVVGGGEAEVRFVAQADGGHQAAVVTRVQVLEAELDVALSGPTVCAQNTEGEYQIRVANTGTATVEQVDVLYTVPAGWRVTVVDQPVQWAGAGTQLRWVIARLEPGADQILQFKALATRTGDCVQAVTATAAGGLRGATEHATQIVDRPVVTVAVACVKAPVAVGAAAELQVTVTNPEDRRLSGLRVKVFLPEELDPLVGDGCTVGTGYVAFPPRDVEPGEQQTWWQLQAEGRQAGAYTVRVSVEGDSLTQPLTAETRVAFVTPGEPVASPPAAPAAAPAAGAAAVDGSAGTVDTEATDLAEEPGDVPPQE